MKFLIVICLCVAASARPSPDDNGYRFSAPSTPFVHRQQTDGVVSHRAGVGQPAAAGAFTVRLSAADDDDDDSDEIGFAVAGASRSGDCAPGLLRHVDGSCVEPQIGSSVYLYNAPHIASQVARADLSGIAKPRVNYNIVFVRTPEGAADLEPIVVPPPQQRTLVYVLTSGDSSEQRVIEVPEGAAHAPEVFYVNTDGGANPQLPIGIDLRSALQTAAAQQGQLIEGGLGAGIDTRVGTGAATGVGAGFATGAGVDAVGGTGGFTVTLDSSDEDDSLTGPAIIGQVDVRTPSRTYG